MSAAGLLGACSEPETPETALIEPEPKAGMTVVANARIHTVDAGGTLLEAGAMAFGEDGTIEGIGDTEAILAAFPGAEVLDLAGRTIVPGLIDSHAHLAGLAQSFTRANLVGTKSLDEVLDRLREGRPPERCGGDGDPPVLAALRCRQAALDAVRPQDRVRTGRPARPVRGAQRSHRTRGRADDAGRRVVRFRRR